MEIILLKDVKGIGKKGETKQVSDGYANNYLIPHKLAVIKTKESLDTLNKQKEAERLEQERLKEIALKNKAKLESMTLEFTAKSQKDGSMAGTISTKTIEETLKKKYQILIDKRKFIDKVTINAFGVTILKIELYKDVVATIKIHVSEEK
ncbi:MAG: 50S ribosomal protein L9 [Candidatus Onthovivens sp.]|nr:50S ribosomal protein L9 [Candidatus Onthovivens sp.]